MKPQTREADETAIAWKDKMRKMHMATMESFRKSDEDYIKSLGHKAKQQ